jgi:hypothetical protein
MDRLESNLIFGSRDTEKPYLLMGLSVISEIFLGSRSSNHNHVTFALERPLDNVGGHSVTLVLPFITMLVRLVN